jgi:hypothetical protein
VHHEKNLSGIFSKEKAVTRIDVLIPVESIVGNVNPEGLHYSPFGGERG